MPPAFVTRTAQIPLRADGGLRLAVVADTHSQPHPRTHALVEALAPDAILHAGDIGDLQVLEGFAAIAPLFAIRGNIDTRAADLPDALAIDLTAPDGAARLRLLLTHIAVAGPRLRADAAKLARTQRASLVVCGHSHVPFVGSDRGLAIFNPGSVGPRRFTLPIVFGTLEVAPTGKLRMAHVDCETGAAWLPPAF